MSWREGSSPPTMWRAVRTTLFRALRLPAVLFPNQAVMQRSGCSPQCRCRMFWDAGAHSKLPQPQEEEALMCLLQHCICVSGPCEILSDVNARNLKLFTRSTGVLLMVMGVCSLLCLLKSTTSSLVLSMLSERWFSWHHLVRVLTSAL